MTTKPQDQRDIEAREALKPCPFCGGTDIEIANTHTPKFWVECNGCEAEARGEYFEGPPAESHFHYDPMPNSDFDGDYEQLPENYKAAFRSAIDAWNARPAPEALEPHRIYQVLDVDACMWEDVTEEQYRERLPSNRRVLFSRPPASLFVSAAPEALGAAKGELSDAEIEEFVAPLIQEHLSGYARHYVTYNDGRSNDRVSSDMRNLTRAILAKAKGEQA
jgi:hypothetical protein